MKELPKLWVHQKLASDRASSISKFDGFAFLFEQGTGKTAATIQTLRTKYVEAGRVLRTIILCPPVVRRSWEREFSKYSRIDSKHITVLDGSGKSRVANFNKEVATSRDHIFITNYESLLMPDLFQCFLKWGIEVLVLDESQRVKNSTSKRTKKAITLGDIAHYKYLLSGTPITKNPMDIWAQYRVLDGGETFDKNFYAFRARYFYDKNAGMKQHLHFPNWQPLPGLDELFHQKIYAKAMRVLKKDCLDLPPIVRQRIEVELDPVQARMYEDMKKHYIAYLNDKACVANIALTKGLRLLQMVSGFFVDDEGKSHAFKKNPRLDALEELLIDIAPHSKVIVWSSFRDSYSSILDVCTRLGLGSVTLIGGMTDKARQESIDSFQTDSSVRVMVANASAGGVGVTLTAASYMLYFSRDFNLENDLQSEARCHRGGSEIHDKITRIDIVATGTIDEVVLTALESKENMMSGILNIRGKL